jgi:hypothetical protein
VSAQILAHRNQEGIIRDRVIGQEEQNKGRTDRLPRSLFLAAEGPGERRKRKERGREREGRRGEIVHGAHSVIFIGFGTTVNILQC